jgi:predicted GNAT superfamily acetyltransferase
VGRVTTVEPAGRTGTDGRAAAAAAASARVTVRTLEALDELSRVDGLFAGIWGSTGQQVAMPVNLLRALTHSGNYVTGAFRADALVGAAVAFLGERDGEGELHSHVAGVARGLQGSGVGYALKLHQRDWAVARGIRWIEWTYDPLVRRNGFFNLVKLGARAVAYYPNFYGLMEDELNGSDETDRCLIRWDLAAPSDVAGARHGPDRLRRLAPLRMLATGAGGSPVIESLVRPGSDVPLSCQVPVDVVAMRRVDPDLAGAWRLALRATMGAAMEVGYVATGMVADGSYLLERPQG